MGNGGYNFSSPTATGVIDSHTFFICSFAKLFREMYGAPYFSTITETLNSTTGYPSSVSITSGTGFTSSVVTSASVTFASVTTSEGRPSILLRNKVVLHQSDASTSASTNSVAWIVIGVTLPTIAALSAAVIILLKKRSMKADIKSQTNLELSQHKEVPKEETLALTSLTSDTKSKLIKFSDLQLGELLGKGSFGVVHK